MTHLTLNPNLIPTLKDKVVVLTGGATGIGREAVKQFHEAGANLIFGDISPTPAHTLLSSLTPPNPPNILFQETDASSYTSQIALFRTAYAKLGRIDIVIANAGVSVPKDPFDFSAFDATGKSEEEQDREMDKGMGMQEVEVNLKGVLYTARIGMYYLRKNNLRAAKENAAIGGKGRGEGGDLILVSSIAGFKESTGLGVYTASKHGVVGVMRGIRVQAEREGVRVNVVCPWMTKTGMVAGIEAGWRALSLPENTPASVATSFLLLASASRGRSTYNKQSLTTTPKPMHGRTEGRLPYWGKMIFVAGGKYYEIEEKFDRLEPEWLGRENSRVLKVGQEFLMDGGTSWDVEKAKL